MSNADDVVRSMMADVQAAYDEEGRTYHKMPACFVYVTTGKIGKHMLVGEYDWHRPETWERRMRELLVENWGVSREEAQNAIVAWYDRYEDIPGH